MPQFQMIAKTFKGLENVLVQELIRLGATDVQTDRRVVTFKGDKTLLYKANLHLRTASRILVPICTFRADDTDDLYKQVKNINWNKYLNVNQSFAIDSTVYSETFTHSQFITYRVKDAIVDWFNEHEDKRPRISVSNPDIFINIHISHDTCTLSLDSSGESLHKRGWRAEQTEAPINEALAAGMLLLAGWDGQCDLVDPFCGSGTLLIEAALIALGIPPGIYRSSFAFEKWQDFDKNLFEELYNDDTCEREFSHHIYGSDKALKAIRIAERNIKSANLQKYITVETADIKDLQPKTQNCLIVTNPPYGERLNTNNIMELYAVFGEALKHRFAGSTAWVISSDERYLKNMGLKPATRIPLLNGALDCWFNKYELFSGKRNDFVREHKRPTTNSNMQKATIIVAGGRGSRFMSDIPKQFLPLNNKPVLMHTIERFHAYDREMPVIVVLPEDQTAYWQTLCTRYKFAIPHTIVSGGVTRTESVCNGLRHTPDNGLVAIHDGVRPLVSNRLITQCFEQAQKNGCAIPTIPATDTLRHITGRLIDRSTILFVQTPQVFDAAMLKKAYSDINRQSPTSVFTDDASVFEAAGNQLFFIDGERSNLKITTPTDLALAQIMHKQISNC